METYTVEIINERAIMLLKNLESLNLIRVQKQIKEDATRNKHFAKYKGAMQKQPLDEVEMQLNELRDSWQ